MYQTLPPADAARRLLAWYDRHHRDLPWRISPSMSGNGGASNGGASNGAANGGVVADPYHIWLSEVMLQQTTVQAVKPYFRKFLDLWPTVNDLAAADTEEVMKAWAGLGYYARARNLKKCAEAVARDHGGVFPDTLEGLKALPGIGDYTAAAVSAIAFNRQSAVLDGNVERVISRLYAVETPLPSARPQMRALVAAMTPTERPGDFAQGMMDLGATICTPRRPACALCPLNDGCLALKTADPQSFPRKAAKKDKPLRLGAAFVASAADGAIYLQKRAETGLLGGMTEVPGTPWTSRIDGDHTIAAQPFAANWEPCGTITHVFTHFELRLSVYRATVATQIRSGNGWWEPLASLNAQALPTVMKKAIAQAIPNVFS